MGGQLNLLILAIACYSLGLDIFRVVILFILACCGFLFFLYKCQENLLYQPAVYAQCIKPSQNPPNYKSPSEHDMNYEDVYLTTSDGLKLHGWWLSHEEPRSRPTILFFHANASNMGFRLPNLVLLHKHLGYNVFIVSYRGYGESEGTPGEEGMLLDAESAWQHLNAHKDVDPDKIVVFGRSLGGAVAIAVAAKHGGVVRGLILENTFLSINVLVDKLFPFLKLLKKWLLRLKWESGTRIASVTAPVLFLSGEQDEVVPNWHMTALHDKATGAAKRTFMQFPAGKHNDTWLVGGSQYVYAVADFVKEVTGYHIGVIEEDVVAGIMAGILQGSKENVLAVGAGQAAPLSS